MKKALKSRYGLKESVQPLSTELHARMQRPEETLADLSSALNSSAALKERFVTGVRGKQIQRELRRILFSAEGKPFIDMRKEVL